MVENHQINQDYHKVTFHNGDNIKGVWIADTDGIDENWQDFGRLYIYENGQIVEQWNHVLAQWQDYFTVEQCNAEYTFFDLTGV